MNKTYALSGIVDWLKEASIRKTRAKKREKNNKHGKQKRIKVFRKMD